MKNRVFLLFILVLVFITGCSSTQNNPATQIPITSTVKSTAWTNNNNLQVVSAEKQGMTGLTSTKTINGKIFDAISLQPISGALIYINSNDKVASDNNGSFSISNAPLGENCITVFCDKTQKAINGDYVFEYQSVSIVTLATQINFYLNPIGKYKQAQQAQVEIIVEDEKGLPIEDAQVFIGNTTYNTWFEGSPAKTDKTGKACVEKITTGSIVAAASKPGLGGGYIQSPIAINSNPVSNIKITVPSNQGEVKGSVSLPAGFSLSQAEIIPEGAALPIWYLKSGEINGNSFSVKGPYGNNHGLLVSALDKNKNSIAVVNNVKISQAPLSVSVNLLEPPNNINALTFGGNSNNLAKITWTSPTTWSPDLYLVYVSSRNPSFSWYGLTQKTSIDIPKFASISNLNQATVFAVKTTAAFDINNFNLASLNFTHLAGENIAIQDKPINILLVNYLSSALNKDNRLKLSSNVYPTGEVYINGQECVNQFYSRFGEGGASLLVDSIVKMTEDLHDVELKLNNAYNINEKFKMVVLDTMIGMSGGGQANIDGTARFFFFPPDYIQTNKILKGVIAHEYGHFLYFHDTKGSLFYDPTIVDKFPIDLAEMNKNNVINRYHIKNIYLKPYYSNALTKEEHSVLLELIAHKLVPLLTSQIEAIQTFEGMFKIMENNWKNMNIHQILLAYFLSKEYNMGSWETKFKAELLSRPEIQGEAHLNSIIAKIKTFYDTLEFYP